jgi:hypothetical protein
MAFGPGARIEGWSTRPKKKKRRKKEALKKVFASHHHRRNFLFVLATSLSQFSSISTL